MRCCNTNVWRHCGTLATFALVAEWFPLVPLLSAVVVWRERAERFQATSTATFHVAFVTKSKRKQVQEKLIKFATRIPAFMYLTDFRENTLQDVITKIEPDLFKIVTGLTVKDFHLLVKLKVFNTEHMNQAVFAFRRYENASLRYTGIDSHEGLTQYGGFDTVIARA